MERKLRARRRAQLILLCAFAAYVCLMPACRKPDSGSPQNLPSDPVSTAGRVLVLCEGAYGNGNASLDLYIPDTKQSYTDLYRERNGAYLGDVVQSISRIGGSYFLCVNNSGKVVVTDTLLKRQAEIEVPQPRYIFQVSGSITYVSSLFSKKLYRLDPAGRAITGTYDLDYKNAEDMKIVGGFGWICCWDTACHSILLMNTSIGTVTDIVSLGPAAAPRQLVQDRDSNAWVISGSTYEGKPGYLTCLSPGGTMLRQFALPASVEPLRLSLSPDGAVLYLLETDYNGQSPQNGLFRMSIHDAALPSEPFIAAAKNQYYYGLGIHPATGDIYIADPKGFSQRGSVTVYHPDGSQAAQFSTGVGPAHFYFAP